MSQDLDKLKDSIDQLIATINEKKQVEKTGQSNNWVVTLVLSVFVVLLTAVFGFLAWRKGKEVAKLKHAAARAEEDKHQASVDLALKENSDLRDAALQAAAAAEQEAQRLQEALAKANEEHAEAIRSLESIVSWDDVDRYLGRR